MFTFRDSIRESGDAGRIFLEAWAGVSFGVQWFTKNMVNGAIRFLEVLHDIIRIVAQDLTNLGRAMIGLGKIELPKLELPKIDVLPLEEYRRTMGLIATPPVMTFMPGSGDPGFRTSRAWEEQRMSSQQTSLLGLAQFMNMQSSRMGPPSLFPSQMFNTGMSGSNDPFAYSSGGVMDQRAYNITVNAGLGADGATLGADIVDIISQYERLSGPVFARYE
jgi:hypothetical protein